MLRASGLALLLAWLWLDLTGDSWAAFFVASSGLAASLVAWTAAKEKEVRNER
ncbi:MULTISPECIES: hypothetical protein [Thermus]|uniref:hypothetical protein n=1 Tax=Thermus TaxID=270 RepID=UPI0003DDA565|nr:MULTISPECIES: hypothetical protein [Thermus]ETN89087.1 hypothetical protein TNMX_03540 [Thermus sp. NMX2.A1]ULR40154.1 hypothetical protein MI302_08465 [Thermus sp. NEB1569]